MKRSIVVFLSDPHCGHRFGLLNPLTQLPHLEDIGLPWIPEKTELQRIIWTFYKQDLDKVISFANSDPIHLIMMGDIVQGTLLYDQKLVTARAADQKIIAQDVFKYWFDLPNLVQARFIKGTAVHSMKHGSVEIELAHFFSQVYKKDIQAYHHILLNIDGVELDCAHHGPGSGIREWTKGNILRLYTKDIMFKSIGRHEKPPDMIVRGHFHERVLELVHIHADGMTHKTWGVICPAYSIFADSWTQKVTKSSSYMTCGLVMAEIIDGRIKEVIDLVHSIDIRKREVYDGN